MKTLKKCLPDLLAILFFVLISLAYFFVPTTRGMVIGGGDNTAGIGLGRENSLYQEKTGEQSFWLESAFSGMPTYQISPSYKSTSVLTKVVEAYHLWLPNYVWFIFVYLIGFYILLRVMKFKPLLSAGGAVIWTFSSYFLIIIGAGHLWKVMALAYLPPLIAGIVLAYRGKYLWGLLVTAIFSAFEVNANHAQMTYYYLFIILFLVIAYLVMAIKEKKLPQFVKASVVCIVAAAIGVAINASNLYHTWEYQKESMRGKSELVKKENPQNQTSSGLDRDYITQWSYGIGETWTLLIPNAKGGSSQEHFDEDIVEKNTGDSQMAQICSYMPQYWGDQPGTSGPVYVGAFVLFLFILGLFIVKGPVKWALLAATVLSILLSWGKNFMGFTDFFIDYIPMYAKFRTVASILVIAEFTIPLLAIMALKKVVDDPDILRKKMKFVWISLGCTAGIAFLFWLMPGVFFDFSSVNDDDTLKMMLGGASLPAEQLAAVISQVKTTLVPMREAVFRADCLRSIVVILIGMVLLLLYKAKKLKASYMVGCVLALCLIDMWAVDKRYLNDGMFSPKDEAQQTLQPSAADELIMKDKAPDYRVLNMTVSTFNDNTTSYFHHSIGGYHPAKLRRYQELVDAYIMPEMQNMNKALAPENLSQGSDGMIQITDKAGVLPVLDMLNMKYLIIPAQGGQPQALRNNSNMGCGWFVNKVNYVDNANEEIDGVGKIDLHHEAVADKKFEAALGQSKENDSTAKVTMTAFAPNNLKYDVTSKNGGVVVFSEVYYPEWTATVDGKPADLGRVNYVLRALKVGPGSHKVVLDFHPKSVSKTETISYIASAILLLIIIAIVFIEWKNRKKEVAVA